jgi:hypothetical protein
MAQKSDTKATSTPASKPAARNIPKPAYTLERAILLAPTDQVAAAIERSFALEGVDYHGIREATEEMLVKSADLIRPNMNDKALETYLQRITGAYVGSACAAGVSNRVQP